MWIDRQIRKLLRPKSLVEPLGKRIAIVEACSIGIVSALAAVGLKQSVAWLDAWRVDLAGMYSPWLVLPLIGIVGGYLSGLLVERLAPEASGSGIPQVKAALGYVPIALDLRVAIVKWLSTALSLGSGLALGRQGPTVQIGAALAAQLSHWAETSPTYQRQLIAAGAAAGLAASFNAPIAGVLFAIEELMQDVSDLTLGTAIIAAVVGGVIARALGGGGMLPDLSQVQIQFDLAEIPLLIAVGMLAGLVGVLFNRSLLASVKLYRRQFRDRSLAVKVAVAGGITSILTILLPHALQTSRDLQDFAIVGRIDWQMAAWILGGQFVLSCVGFGSTAPGGLFAPSLILGAALGNLVATGAQSCYHHGILPTDLVLSSPTVYALTGMSALFSAVTHRPMVAIAIVWEMTAEFDLVLPLMLGAVVAYLVAEKLFPGSIYQHVLSGKGINLDLPDLAQQSWVGLTAADLMQRRVETLSSQMTLAQAVRAFANSPHRGFPIVDDGQLVGIITQRDLSVLEDRQWHREATIATLMTRRLITVSPSDPLTSVLHLLDRYQIGRLPVVDGRKLVGIITRADIIRVEAERVSSTVSPLKTRSEPSYLVYRTQSPATGRGRLLVPLSNPQTADLLLRLAAAIALESNYELECLHAIVIPRSSLPAETPVDLTASRQLCDRATAVGKTLGIPVHTQIRVTHNVAATILETVRDRHIDLLCMGWQGKTSHPGRIFGTTVDLAIQQAPCHVMLIKLGERLQPNVPADMAIDARLRLTRLHRWLVPIAGGPNTEYALQLLPALIALNRQPDVHLCQVFPLTDDPPDLTNLNTAADAISQSTNAVAKIATLYSDDIPRTAIDYAIDRQCDAIILGASREGLLKQSIQGNIPEAIARGSDCTVIVVRAAIAVRV
ncbi:chloride channel protein [Chamaesiphon polymorphus]|uniref:Chloride channel protein n=1 Tax=Chamaesiphon polymorphus CCALA 037 TaxID=2107692 RepID=A0A2T1FZU6_9CYAN|nr:chloride channel protein [Chamaesiphon polymorphus]PSB50481.1 chloride channel protein [Chamaesiphon polymorphus CCALA 037]